MPPRDQLRLGVAGIGLGLAGIRQTRRAARPGASLVGGRGMAVAGLACGGAGLVVVACSLGLATLAVFG